MAQSETGTVKKGLKKGLVGLRGKKTSARWQKEGCLNRGKKHLLGDLNIG